MVMIKKTKHLYFRIGHNLNALYRVRRSRMQALGSGAMNT